MGAREFAFETDHERQTYGGGISIDQLLTPQFGVFVRAGFNQIEGISQTFFAASGGFRWTGPLWNRPRDRLGVGYSFQREMPGDEQVAEVYYNLFLTDYSVRDRQCRVAHPRTEPGDWRDE